jgi:S-DNA-T family DNA segregation ATPase FtsK/SpoIIIE
VTPSELIGTAGANTLRQRINALTPDDGVARYLLDRLTGAQVAAITKALLADPTTSAKIKIALPRQLVAGADLPESVLTDDRTVAIRNAECDRPALLIANTDDDQGASLGDLTLIGSKQLTEEVTPWIEAAAAGLVIDDRQVAAWKAALIGLTNADDWPLHQIASYVALTRERIQSESVPVSDALGWALPALRLPRDSGYFLSLRDKDREQPSRWKKLYEKLLSERRPLLAKQRPNRQIIESDELKEHFTEVKDQIPDEVHSAIEAFIKAPSGWSPQSDALAAFEWESQSVLQLFSGIKLKKTTLAEETINFYEYEFSDRLSQTDTDYLKALKKRSLKEPRDDDREFFEAHREELGNNKSLRAKWERFVYGRPIECTDFLDGLLVAIERLFGQMGSVSGSRKLIVRSGRRSRKSWLDLNADIGLAFGMRYRGLKKLMGSSVEWDTPHLFEYEMLLDHAKSKQKKYRRNVSTARSALQIKFDITLSIGADQATVQLIWSGQPASIGFELPKDLGRLLKRPFSSCAVSRLPVNRKGALQSVSLADVGTLQPAFGQDSGTLVPRTTIGRDIAKTFAKALKDAVQANRVEALSANEIIAAWEAFADQYRSALGGLQASGYASPTLLTQAHAYGNLLRTLTSHARGDRNRLELLEPVLQIGIVQVLGGPPSAIIPPWHPLRLAGSAAKMRSVAGLISYLLTDVDVNFGDRHLFFADLRNELGHPVYPEIAVGYQGEEPVLLTESVTLNEYSLFERPVRDPAEETTDVDPAEAARQIRSLIERYLELQPHECSNLSIMLYNCDAAGLPLAAVNALGSVQDQDAVHCNVLVRHRDRSRLSRIYSELLERSENDPDALVVSETSPNFMSKLRIGVMLESNVGQDSKLARPVDVAFLHDVVSRHAREQWFSVPAEPQTPSLTEHIPARWSYRRVTSEDELKATNYLTCPRQPEAGWAYIDAVAHVIRRQPHNTNEHYLPARQISFQDRDLKNMFEEVHELAEWVATYDDLLDKRQLAAQDIKVIRYRRQRTHGRNMVVSSTSELRILQVLVRRRLTELSLGLDSDRLSALANRMIEDANEISGDIVMRAAKHGVSAGELIGLVLSRALIAEEFDAKARAAWFLLDDYAEWLGQKEEGIADILGLSIVTNEADTPVLRAIVTEAKYVDQQGSADASRKSRSQLYQTISRMDQALFGDPGRLDRDLWLSRISDLLLDGTTTYAQPDLLESVRDGLRKGEIPIDLRGYSHVFVHSPASDGTSLGEQLDIGSLKGGLQETFTREGVRSLIKAYESGTPLTAVRAALGDARNWELANLRKPADRINWTVEIASDASASTTPSNHNYEEDEQEEQLPSNEEMKVTEKPTSGPSPSETLPPQSDPIGVSPVPEEVTRPPPPSPSESPPSADGTSASNIDTLITDRAHKAQEDSSEERAWLEATTQKLRSALMGYNLQAKVEGSRLTPNAALVRFKGSDRLRVEDIEARQSALLTTHGLRLISISPLPGEIVVGVARPTRQIVSLWDVWARRGLNRNTAGVNTSFVLGLKELDGEILYLNLGGPFAGGQQHEPHTLVAGATGSGKSVLIQTLLLDIAATNPSSLAHIYLIDPKMGVDYAALERLPHLQGGVITEQTRAIEVMESLVAEMERRYELFRSKGARDIRTFNMQAAAAEQLPYIFLVHDEFAEWMLTEEYKAAVTSNVSRLGVKARAAGMHLIFAAQRPDANVMPMQLRDNLGNRLILKVSSVGTSEIALGTKGAEQLLGLGHLAARLSGEPSIIFAQAPFMSDEDIDATIDAILNSEASRS